MLRMQKHWLFLLMKQCPTYSKTSRIEEKGKLSDPFYRLEHQEEDLKKKKETEPVLVRLQQLADSRHSDDYSRNRALRAQLRGQNKRVAEEENASRKRGLAIRLLPLSEEDKEAAANVKFSSKFEKNRREKRAIISSGWSIFGGTSAYSSSDRERVELEAKMRRISATAVDTLLSGGRNTSQSRRV